MSQRVGIIQHNIVDANLFASIQERFYEKHGVSFHDFT